MHDTIQEGDHVVLVKSFDADNIKIISVDSGTTVHYGKLHFDPGPLVGAKYGSVFQVDGETMTRIEDFESFDNDLSTEFSNKLADFDSKTQFSREKIIKKKKQKNRANILTVIRPSLMQINEMLYARDKIGGLRPDILSQILTSSNIQSGSTCLLLDHNLGLLTGAVMSRILPAGTCVQLIPDYEYICTTRKTLNMLNIKEEQVAGKLSAITVRDLHKVSRGLDDFTHENDIMKARGEEHLVRLENRSTRAKDEGETTKGEAVIDDCQSQVNLQLVLMKKDANRESRNNERIRAAELLKSKSISAMILIAQSDHPLPLLKLSYQFLQPSSQFVIYSDTAEPLLECHDYLKSNCLAVALNLSESWLRRYQVLPDRTRPAMNTSGFGGYLLSGIKALYGPDYSGDKRPTEGFTQVEMETAISTP